MDKLNLIFHFIADNWKLLTVIYETIVRIIPTRINLSIVDNIWKILDFIVKNKRIPNGNERKENLTDTENIIKVKINKHILRSVLLFLLIIGGCSESDAQTYQNFKGVIFRNTPDSMQYRNVAASSGNIGMIAYNQQRGVLQGYQDSVWYDLINAGGINAVIGYNGVTDVDGDSIKLGGTLTENTAISGNFDLTLAPQQSLVLQGDTDITGSSLLGTVNFTAGTDFTVSTNDDVSLIAVDEIALVSDKAYLTTNLPLNNSNDSVLVINNSNRLERRSALSIGGSPAGSNTQIQYNNSGVFGASSTLTFTTTNSILQAGDLRMFTTGVVNVLEQVQGSAGSFTIQGATRNGGGGNMNILGGAAISSGFGGVLNLGGGQGISTGGGIVIQPGSGTTTGGSLQILNGGGATGGNILLSSTNGTTDGNIDVEPGTGSFLITDATGDISWGSDSSGIGFSVLSGNGVQITLSTNNILIQAQNNEIEITDTDIFFRTARASCAGAPSESIAVIGGVLTQCP